MTIRAAAPDRRASAGQTPQTREITRGASFQSLRPALSASQSGWATKRSNTRRAGS